MTMTAILWHNNLKKVVEHKRGANKRKLNS